MIKSASLASLVKIPMMLTACCCMWYEEDAYSAQSTNKKGHGPNNFPDIHISVTHTYLSLVDSMIRRADEKYDLKAFLTKLLPSRKEYLLKALSKCLYIRSFLGTILPLCRLAYTDLISDETKLVFQKDELEDKIGRPLVQLALRVGLISQSKAPGRFHQQNVSINFYHKTIQEFMAAIHLTCTDTDDIRSYCTSLDKVMEVNNIITFMVGIDPSSCRGVSKHVMNIANVDAVQLFRRTLDKGGYKRVKQLYQAQCGWYREATYCHILTGDTSPPPILYVSDIALDINSDIDTVRLTEEIMYSNLDNIVSVVLICVNHPLQRILQYIPQCSLLSSLGITYMSNKEDNDQLLSVIPHLTQLDNIVYWGAAAVTAADTDDDWKDVLPVYDEADVKVVKAILQLKQLKRMWLMWVDLGDDGMQVTGDMIRLQEVVLGYILMSARSWDIFVLSFLTLRQAVDVGLEYTNIDNSTVSRILTSHQFTVTSNDDDDDDDDDNDYHDDDCKGKRDDRDRYKVLYFTTVPQQMEEKDEA